MRDQLLQMEHKDLILLPFGLLQLRLIALFKLALDLVEELQAFNPVLGDCHACCEVRRKSVLHHDWGWMADFAIGIGLQVLPKPHLVKDEVLRVILWEQPQEVLKEEDPPQHYLGLEVLFSP